MSDTYEVRADELRRFYGEHLDDETLRRIWEAQNEQRRFIERGGNSFVPRVLRPAWRFSDGVAFGAAAVTVLYVIAAVFR
jgi:hypothetical protein